MLTASSALHWEIRRSLQVRLLGVFVLLLFIPGLALAPNIERQLRGIPINPEELAMSPGVHLVVNIINLIICLFGIGQAVGMSVRQYTLPVPAHVLATIRLLPGAFCSAALYLIVSILFNVLFRAEWPIVGPALTYGVGYMVMYATIHRFRGNETRMVVAGLVMGTVLLFWLGGHYGRLWWVRPEHSWSDLTLNELLILGLVAALSWRSLVGALESDRRGAGWGRVRERTAQDRAVMIARQRPARRFVTAFSAFFWQDWRQDGWLVPIVVVSLLAIGATVHVGHLIGFREARADVPIHGPPISVTLLGFIPLCAILPWFLGLSGQYGKRAATHRQLPTGQSTLPLSDAAMGWVCLTRVIASSLMAAVGALLVGGVWLGAVHLVARWFAVPMPYDGLDQFNGTNFYRYLGILALILWLSSGFSTAATLSGRRWIASLPLILIPLWLCCVFIASMMSGPREAELVLTFFAFTLLSLALLWTIVSYILGIAYDLITYRTILVGFALFALTEFVGISLIEPLRTAAMNSLSPVAYNMSIMLFALAAAPPALIPLATHYNRHR